MAAGIGIARRRLHEEGAARRRHQGGPVRRPVGRPVGRARPSSRPEGSRGPGAARPKDRGAQPGDADAPQDDAAPARPATRRRAATSRPRRAPQPRRTGAAPSSRRAGRRRPAAAEGRSRDERDDQGAEAARNRASRADDGRTRPQRRTRPGAEPGTGQGRPGPPGRRASDQQTRTARTGDQNRTRTRTGRTRTGRTRTGPGRAAAGQPAQPPPPGPRPRRPQDERGRRSAHAHQRTDRGRDRDTPRRRQRNEPDTTILEDDVLVPAAGILDVLDNYAFVRTSGYLPGTDDVYVSLSMVRKYGLRRGDAIVGQVRQPREGERKEKFNPMVRIDSRQRRRPRGRQEPRRVRQADPALPERAAAPRDRADQPDRPGHRHRRPDRQGPARPDRVAVQGRQDDDHAVDRELDHDQQPRVPPDGRARRRASRGGHRLRALGQGRGHLLDVRPPGRRPHDGRRARHRAGQAPRRARPRRRRAARRHHPPGPRLQPRRPGVAAGSCPAASTRRRSTRRRSSSAPPATSRTAAR